MKRKQYVFDKINDLIGYIYSKNVNFITPLQLQACLYLLYSYYITIYSNKDYETDANYQDFPKEMFDTKFEAWNYNYLNEIISLSN